MVEKTKTRKCPGTSSLDSGHLYEPFGPLMFYVFQYFKAFVYPFFLFAYFPLALTSHMAPIGPLMAPLVSSRLHDAKRHTADAATRVCHNGFWVDAHGFIGYLTPS